ncbi:ALDH-like protein [Testicularia cyperi]|uniref:aldehyde dehydrogenase (NAD(+)) n=1 Tax=Testicularia cyperi TaxID=1882483 RepID=A0A317Y0X3_9BASI|nr:ALDH-like protein [Testicularia cyperi]
MMHTRQQFCTVQYNTVPHSTTDRNSPVRTAGQLCRTGTQSSSATHHGCDRSTTAPLAPLLYELGYQTGYSVTCDKAHRSLCPRAPCHLPSTSTSTSAVSASTVTALECARTWGSACFISKLSPARCPCLSPLLTTSGSIKSLLTSGSPLRAFGPRSQRSIPRTYPFKNENIMPEPIPTTKPAAVVAEPTTVDEVFSSLGLPTPGSSVAGVFDGEWKEGEGSGSLTSFNPATGKTLATVRCATAAQVQDTIQATHKAQRVFAKVPAATRGQVMKDICAAYQEHKAALGALISFEMGKVLSEGKGEVQEVIDVADMAVGLSRSIKGSVLPSERPGHVIYELPNPLGLVGVITAFNFPVAVHGWNFCLSFVCGNGTIWKPSPSTPLTAIATTKLITKVLEKHGLPLALASLVCGDVETGQTLTRDDRVQLTSFTGSEKIGKVVAQDVAARLGKILLELGGNNAAIVLDDADLELAVPGVAFAAIGTAGQRCTTTRRLLLQRNIADRFLERLVQIYSSVVSKGLIGDPTRANILCGPLHSSAAVQKYWETLDKIQSTGGKLIFGPTGPKDERLSAFGGSGHYVLPAITMPASSRDEVFQEEVFAPILNVAVFDTLEEAIELNNSVRQGLSSSLFTTQLTNIGDWQGALGSDCGIVNVNVSTSGAEVGAGFGGNKATGWGRECGGDSWKQYCRWATSTVNYSSQMTLAQGVKFDA